jgi:hypothetical protein
MELMDQAPNGAYWLKSVFDSQWKSIQTSVQATDAGDLDFDLFQVAAAVEIAKQILDRLRNNPKARSLDYVVLATTAHMYGIMSARPLICRYASASHVDYVNVVFAASSAFTRFGFGSFLNIDPQINRRFLMNFYGRATWPEPFAGKLDSDLERDLSAMLFFFEAYMRPGVWVRYKFRNPRPSHRFR